MSRRTAPAAVLVFVAALLLYLPSLRNDFAYDDVAVIQLDERAHDISRAHRYFTESYWLESELGLYRPLTSISFAADWALSGGTPAWFHFVNALWNAVACLLLFLVLLRLVSVWPAVIAALLFAAHPVHVEAVANVVGRSEVMAAVFTLAALLVWLRRAPDERPGTGASLVIAALFALALLSKESAIMLPALLALVDAGRGALRPDNVRPWLHRHALPILLMAAVGVAFLVARTLVLGGLGPPRVDPLLEVATSTDARIRTALQAWPVILRLLIYPRVLLADYGPRILMPAFQVTAGVAAGAVILGAACAGGIAAWLRGHRRTALTLLWVPLALLPVSNLIIPIGVIVAERALYLPSVAVAFAAAFTADWFGGRSTSGERNRAAVSFAVLCLLVTGLFTARTLSRIPVWRDTDTVLGTLLRDRPDSFRAAWHHARLAAAASQPDSALHRYARTLELWPYRRRVVTEAAAYAAWAGDLDLAVRLGRFAMERWPDDLGTVRVLAGASLDLGDSASARTAVEHGLRIAPADSLLLLMRSALSTPEHP